MSFVGVMLALLPFVLLLVLVVWLRWSTLKAMPLVWFVTVLVLYFYWKVGSVLIFASFLKGVFVATEIVLIIFGAVWIVQVVRKTGRMKVLKSFLSSISDDARIQVLIIAWLFGSLIEGVAGFGTPAMLVAPLLVSVGFAPLLAVVVALIANSTAVSFGAVGLPVSLGIGSLGFGNGVLKEIASSVASLHFIVSFIVPLALVWFVVANRRDRVKRFFEAVPFALFAWLCFVIPYFLLAWFVGPELPSIVGGIVGLFVVVGAVKFGFLVPRREVSFCDGKKRKKFSGKKIFGSVLPYLLIVLFLSLSRLFPVFVGWLKSVSVGWENILGSSLSYEFFPFFAPSFFILVAGLISFFVYRGDSKVLVSSLGSAWKRVRLPFVALIFALALVQLFLISGEGSIDSMPLILAEGIGGLFKSNFVFVSPFIGTFGSFLAGSNTVSNLLFASFQAETAALLGLSLILILALQVVGGAVGNMISIHNVLTASSTVGLYGQEGRIIRKTIWVAIVYALLAGILAWFFML